MSQSHTAKKRTPMEILQEFSIPLISGVLIALVWANLSPGSYQSLLHASPFGHDSHLNFHFLMNDILMAFFFGIATKEITEACLPGGALNPPSKAINPLLATVGGVLGPIMVYFAWMVITQDQSIQRGWGIPTATDIALAWLVAKVVFGKNHPAVRFLLLLAVVDDGIGLGIIAIFYPDPAHPVQPIYLLGVAAAMAGAFALRKSKVTSFWPYVLGPGVVSWASLYIAHLHPALALVPIIPMMPNMHHDEGLFAEESSGVSHTDTMNRFEHFFKKPVDFGLLGFGLANAGVSLSSVGNATYAVFLALLVGKTAGVFGFSMLGEVLGFKRPDGMGKKELLFTGLVAALGLTVALFVAGVAFQDPALQGAAKMGALFSGVLGPVIIVLGLVFGLKKAKAVEASLPASGANLVVADGIDAAGHSESAGHAPDYPNVVPIAARGRVSPSENRIE